MKKHLLLTIGLLILCFAFNTKAQEKKTIKIMHADKASYKQDERMQVLTGNVFLVHKNLKMYCDQAFKYNETNIIKASGHIHIIQDDSLHMRGDSLDYDGNANFAKVRDNVVLNDKSMTLKTDFLNFDANTNIGYYQDYGTVKDGMNVLTSKVGQYHANEDLICFQNSVVVTNPDYRLDSDTLKYTTTSKIVYITGPTNIVGEKDTIYTEQGWYNTITKQVDMSKKNRAQRESYFCFGDNIFIDNIKHTAVIKNNGILQDTLNHVMLKGNLIKAFKDIGYAFATEKAHVIQIDKNKDSLFLHADTLTLNKDSINTLVKGFHNVKFFKSSIQGVCDSMSYSMKDSLVVLYKDPVIWASDIQITGDTLRLEMGNSALKKFYSDKNSLIVTKAADNLFNQIKGRSMVGYFKNNLIDYLDVLGSGELLYFLDDKGDISAVNKMKCSDIRIFMLDKKLDRIKYIKSPEGTIYPLAKVEKEELRLKDFRWEELLQPKSKDDIFINNKKTKIDSKKSKDKKYTKTKNSLFN